MCVGREGFLSDYFKLVFQINHQHPEKAGVCYVNDLLICSKEDVMKRTNGAQGCLDHCLFRGSGCPHAMFVGYKRNALEVIWT